MVNYSSSFCRGLIALTLLVLIAAAYWPGLAGPFLFDDFANLDELGAYGPLDDWTSRLYYLTSGTADPTGRPVALLTFLIDAHGWPSDPWPFKRTNLLIHLLNTALLGFVLTRLQMGIRQRRPEWSLSTWSPLLAASLWGAHPFFVSTTLYVVQREAMLPMTFVLLSFLSWDRTVKHFVNGEKTQGWMWATFAFGGCTMLAALSKANGFLAPLLTLLIHCWFIRPLPGCIGRRSSDLAALILLVLPSALLVGYLVSHGVEMWSRTYLPGREWTLPERLMSQPRAIWDYIWHLALPRAGGGGLFVEGFAVSRSWFLPWTTLPATVLLAASCAFSLAARRRFPIISFAWLFFLAAHLIESSVIALELYFEHRNYLPAAFLGWPIAHLLTRPGLYPRYRLASAGLLLSALLLLTFQRASTWGNEELLTALTAEYQEASVRSQVSQAQQEVNNGMASGITRIRGLQRTHPDSVIVAVNAIALECIGTGNVLPGTLARSVRTLGNARIWNYGLYTWMRDAALSAKTRSCHGFGMSGLRDLVAAAEENPVNQSDARRRDLWHVRGRIALAEHRPELALKWFDAALKLQPDPDYALVQAAALGNAGAQRLGIAHLEHYRLIEERKHIVIRDMYTLHRWLLRRSSYYQTEIDDLVLRLEADSDVPLRSRHERDPMPGHRVGSDATNDDDRTKPSLVLP